MTRYSSSYTISTSTNTAVYNAFHGKFSLALQAVLTKTADTGQAVFGTTAVATQFPGTSFYEIYAFNDSLQATKPIYLRVDYVGSSNYDLYLTVGTGTDGAGNLSGQLLTQQPMGNNGPSGSATVTGGVRYVYSSGDGSYLNLMTNLGGTATLNPGAPDNLSAITIERTRDADGTPNGNGVNIYRWRGFFDTYAASMAPTIGTYAGVISRAFDTQAPTYGPDIDWLSLIPNKSQVTSYTYGGTAMAYPVYGSTAQGQIQGASKALMIGFVNDWPTVKAAVPVTHYGTTMQFMPMGPYAPLTTSSVAPPAPYATAATWGSRTAVFCPLFRWE